MPCRIKDPNRKGKVEAGVAHAQKTPLKGLRFESLEEAQAYLDRWEAQAGPTRASTAPPSGKWRPCSPKKNPRCCLCPSNPSATTSTAAHRASGRLCGSRSRLLWRYRRAGSGAWSTCNGMTFTCACSIRAPVNCCASMSAKSAAGSASSRKIIPKRAPLGTLQLLARAERAGTHIGAFCQAYLPRRRRTGGAPHPGCALALGQEVRTGGGRGSLLAALELQVHEYRFVRRYLERRPTTDLQQVDPLIRELVHYRDLINNGCSNKNNRSLFEAVPKAPPQTSPEVHE
jgi:hypothetical protein